MTTKREIQEVYELDQFETFRLAQQAKRRLRRKLSLWDTQSVRVPTTYKDSDGVVRDVKSKQPTINYNELASFAASFA